MQLCNQLLQVKSDLDRFSRTKSHYFGVEQLNQRINEMARPQINHWGKPKQTKREPWIVKILGNDCHAFRHQHEETKEDQLYKMMVNKTKNLVKSQHKDDRDQGLLKTLKTITVERKINSVL